MSSKNALNNEDLLIVPTNKSSVRKGRLRKMTSADVVSSMALHPDEKLKTDAGAGSIVSNAKRWMLRLNAVATGASLFGGVYLVATVGFDNAIVSALASTLSIVGAIGAVVVWKDSVALQALKNSAV